MSRPARRLLLRYLLPVALAVGVWAMHTLGHLASHHGEAAPPRPYALAHTGPSEETAHGDTMPERRTELIGRASSVDAFSGPLLGFGASLWLDPTDVCLAVLPLILALVIAAAWARAQAWPRGKAVPMPSAGGVARSPPRRLAPTLAGLSVMRT
jgi:hypothetical protein